MRGHEERARLGACLAAVLLAGGCASSPAATPASPPASTPVQALTPAPSMTTPTPSPAAAVTSPSVAPATPAPTLPASLVGTWTAVIDTPRGGPVQRWEARYTIGQCAAGEECGTWEWHGPITVVGYELKAMKGGLPGVWDWAVLGEQVSCRGSLRFERPDGGDLLLWAWQTSFEAAGGAGCGNNFHRVTLGADGTADLELSQSPVTKDATWPILGTGTMRRATDD